MTDTIVKDPVIEGEEVAGNEEGVPVTPNSGDKTPSALLLESLKEEREKRKILDEEVRILREKLENPPALSDEIFSDEGKTLQGELKTLRTELSEVRGELTKKDVLIAYPVLKEKLTEFEDFRNDPENKGMNMRTAAKAFLVENELIDTQPRKGTEKSTGGPRIPLTTGMTSEDVKTLRETNFRLYTEMLQKGQIKIE